MLFAAAKNQTEIIAMDIFTIQIARTNLEIQAHFGSTREYFKDYLSDSAPEAVLTVCEDERQREQALLDEEADREGLRRRVFSPAFLERNALLRQTAAVLLKKDILLLHGSTLVTEGKAYLFTADCGVGKSTHVRLWQSLLGEQVQILNDDRVFLAMNCPITAYSSPWSGKHGLQNNLTAPLGGICLLQRGSTNDIRRIPPEEGEPLLKKQIFLPEAGNESRLSCYTSQLFRAVPVWLLHCTKDLQAADIAYKAMVASESGK